MFVDSSFLVYCNTCQIAQGERQGDSMEGEGRDKLHEYGFEPLLLTVQ